MLNMIVSKRMVKPVGFLFILLLSFGFTSCDDNDEQITPTAPADKSNLAINGWIYDVMQDLYYWADDIPANVDSLQEPTVFFNSLLSPEDRFSVIVPDYDELINSLSGIHKEAGYEFALTRVDDTGNVQAVILYIKKGSPAHEAGLKRGDVITQINGTDLTMNNYREMVQQMFADHSITYRRFNPSTNTFEEKGSIDLAAVVVSENPNHLDTVYTIGSSKIGYYVYNFFSPGTDGSSAYDRQMDQIIGEFKNKGVNALILDLRYNSGGAASSATNLASLVGSGVNSTRIFYQHEYNTELQDYFNNQPDGGSNLKTYFLEKAENIGSQISNQLYILTGSRTASASELVVSGLMPYMNVTIIGDTTVGKNVGSIAIDDDQNPENEYGLLPIVFKVINSNGFSDYDQGFVPRGENIVADFSLPLKALGDLQEPLLARAVELITGTTSGARKMSEKGLEPIMTSIDLKSYSQRLIE